MNNNKNHHFTGIKKNTGEEAGITSASPPVVMFITLPNRVPSEFLFISA